MPVVALCISPSPCLSCQPSYMGGHPGPSPRAGGPAIATLCWECPTHCPPLLSGSLEEARLCPSSWQDCDSDLWSHDYATPMVEPGLEPRLIRGSFYSHTVSPKYGLFHPKSGSLRGSMSRVWGEGGHDMGFLVQEHLI